VANFDEAGGQHVLDEALEKGDGTERGDLTVLGAEGDTSLVEREEATVGDADAVSVATEIAQDLLGATEGRFAVDMPALAPERGAEPSEALGVDGPWFTGQPKLSRIVQGAERGQ